MVKLEARVRKQQKPKDIDDKVERLALATYNRIEGAENAGIASAETVRIDGRAVVVTGVVEEDVDTINELMPAAEKQEFGIEYDGGAEELRYTAL